MTWLCLVELGQQEGLQDGTRPQLVADVGQQLQLVQRVDRQEQVGALGGRCRRFRVRTWVGKEKGIFWSFYFIFGQS